MKNLDDIWSPNMSIKKVLNNIRELLRKPDLSLVKDKTIADVYIKDKQFFNNKAREYTYYVAELL